MSPSHEVNPTEVIVRIAGAIPESVRHNVVLAGSLAAAYHLLSKPGHGAIRTKDADALLSPREAVLAAAANIVNELLAAGWKRREGPHFREPGDESIPVEKLPVVRLHPPGESAWFLELLATPESGQGSVKEWLRVTTSAGDFAVPSFRFMQLVDFRPAEGPGGLHIARLEMMALANLLSHPKIETATMSEPIGNRTIKRSNKDLGRVLAMARQLDDRVLTGWPGLWQEALKVRFPGEWRDLAARCGGGLRELLNESNMENIEEARHTCEYGLLASRPPTIEQLRATGHRFLQDVIDVAESMAGAK
jgi:hypothetical protein